MRDIEIYFKADKSKIYADIILTPPALVAVVWLLTISLLITIYYLYLGQVRESTEVLHELIQKRKKLMSSKRTSIIKESIAKEKSPTEVGSPPDSINTSAAEEPAPEVGSPPDSLETSTVEESAPEVGSPTESIETSSPELSPPKEEVTIKPIETRTVEVSPPKEEVARKPIETRTVEVSPPKEEVARKPIVTPAVQRTKPKKARKPIVTPAVQRTKPKKARIPIVTPAVQRTKPKKPKFEKVDDIFRISFDLLKIAMHSGVKHVNYAFLVLSGLVDRKDMKKYNPNNTLKAIESLGLLKDYSKLTKNKKKSKPEMNMDKDVFDVFDRPEINEVTLEAWETATSKFARIKLDAKIVEGNTEKLTAWYKKIKDTYEKDKVTLLKTFCNTERIFFYYTNKKPDKITFARGTIFYNLTDKTVIVVNTDKLKANKVPKEDADKIKQIIDTDINKGIEQVTFSGEGEQESQYVVCQESKEDPKTKQIPLTKIEFKYYNAISENIKTNFVFLCLLFTKIEFEDENYKKELLKK